MVSKLLTRNGFRDACLKRDGYKCVNCGAPATYDKNGEVDNLDIHHIIERRLFTAKAEFGGYFVDNGACVCEPCHILAEQTLLSCDALREKCGIKTIVLPLHLYHDQEYDKWGNPVLPNGTRLKGDLFYDLSVQKVLEPVLHLFSEKVKYPRTPHLPWSPGVGKDDRVLDSTDCFVGKEIVITEKMDGECTTIGRTYSHARSVESGSHPSRDWIKALQGRIGYDIPEGWRLCGENLFAKHSLGYNNLKDFFLLFSIWNENNICLSWDETVEWASLLNLHIVPTIYRGVWDEKNTRNLKIDSNVQEGYVVRLADSFSYGDFRKSVAKWVRPSHVTTHGGWMRSELIPNKLIVTQDVERNN